MYNQLAKYYDALLSDEETLQLWIEDFCSYLKGRAVLDVACGSGLASCLLEDKGLDVTAFDLSADMIEEAKKKSSTVAFSVQDMRAFSYEQTFDGIICLVDSLNYINTIQELQGVFKLVYEHLNTKGVFQFDYHQLARLSEFSQEYIEEGIVLGTPYQWTIVAEENTLLERFVFWEKEGIITEHHQQTIFPLEDIKKLMRQVGFKEISHMSIEDEKYIIRGIK